MDRLEDSGHAAAQPRSVSRSTALILLVLLLATGVFAVYFAREASDAAAGAELLSDGIDRSNLPRDEAVALAQLSRSRSASVPHDEHHNHDHADELVVSVDQLSPTDQEELAAELAIAAEVVDRFDSLEAVEAAGYVKGSGESDGAGAHWIKWSLVDRPFDPANPSMLLLDELVSGEGPTLIALSYWVASDGEPEGFTGDADSWHRHLGICFVNGYIRFDNTERGACEGDWVNGMDLWMLHAWVVPGVENRLGLFANVNPLLCEHACGLED